MDFDIVFNEKGNIYSFGVVTVRKSVDFYKVNDGVEFGVFDTNIFGLEI